MTTMRSAARGHVAAAILIAVAAVTLRAIWLTADPPSDPTVGIVWHDEGAWVHSARNKALWGAWRTDNWNPVFVAPVFTALEYASFSAFGVGTWQARVVSIASGLLAVLALGWGLRAAAGMRAALLGSALLATNFFLVMWNRAALMESTMTSLIVVGWAAYARAHAGRPTWGAVAGVAVVLAFFTKAAAAFFVGALVLDAAITLLLSASASLRARLTVPAPAGEAARAASWTIAGLAAASLAVALVFVVPWWTEFRFYNWEMSVTRKPDYTVRAFLDRASWLPVVHDVFTRMWPVLVAGALAVLAVVARWRDASPPMRLLVFWLLIGFAELVVHDSGNERRYVMLVPAVIALAAWLAARDRSVDARADGSVRSLSRWMLAPLILFLAYLVCGSVVRLFDLQAVYAHELAWTVRTSAALAVGLTIVMLAFWTRVDRWVRHGAWPASGVMVLAAIAIGLDLWQYAGWSRSRTDLNYQASLAVGRLVPDGTLVHGKLANGLALENRIRPVFVGRGFGNYADRFERTDIRYLLTYLKPKPGYEGPVILEVLDYLPDERVVVTFPVQETPAVDEAALIDKFPR